MWRFNDQDVVEARPQKALPRHFTGTTGAYTIHKNERATASRRAAWPGNWNV